MVDLASQVSQNIAMVTEVLHTQRDFKEILLRLLNGKSSVGGASPDVADVPDPCNATSEKEEPHVNILPPEEPVVVAPVSVEPWASWMSAETVLLTPNTRNNLRLHRGPLGDMQAVSTDISIGRNSGL